LTSAVPVILASLVSAGLTGLLLSKKAGATEIVNPEGRVIATVPDNLTLQQIANNTDPAKKTYKVIKAYIKRTSTTATSRPNTPNQKVTVAGLKVLNLSMIFDANFKLAGKFDLVINNSTFLSIDAGDLTDTDNYSLDLYTNGWEIPDFQTIELYVWTSNASACAVTLSVTLGV